MGKDKLFGKASLLSSKHESRDRDNSTRTSNFLADLASGNLKISSSTQNSAQNYNGGVVERKPQTQTLNRSPVIRRDSDDVSRLSLPRNMYGNPDKSQAEYSNSPRSRRLQQVHQNQLNNNNNNKGIVPEKSREVHVISAMPRIPTRQFPPENNAQIENVNSSKERVRPTSSSGSVRSTESEERRESDRRRKSQIDQKVAAIENAFLFDQSFMMSQEEAGSLAGTKMRRKFTYNSIRPLPKVSLSRTSSIDSTKDGGDANNGEVNWEKVAREAKQRELIVRENVRSLMQNVNAERTQLQKLLHHYKRELEEKDAKLAQASQGGHESKEADTIAYLKILRENTSLKNEIEKEREKSLNLQNKLESLSSDSTNSTRSRSSSASNPEELKVQSAELSRQKKRIAELEHENCSLEAKLNAANAKLESLTHTAKQQAKAWVSVTESSTPPTKPIKSPQTRPPAPVKPVTLSKKPERPAVLLALHDFESEDPEDLPFAEGDLLILKEREEEEGDGWWTAEYNGKKGKIPSNFVEDLSKPEEMVAIGSFKGECEGDLEFKRGEFLFILNKEDEWWVGQKADGSVGYLPRNYVTSIE
eukprot:TRINITY_DN2307_c0_g1_i1.p1 TRINITY_DN2307_c0_g1~~TRINITY_DN2307_c0_g1_i1.p1  ORF type:complete len:589 (-),score=215.69 TRINITY_DN2307_c0_g1_i1:167-1933(-)